MIIRGGLCGIYANATRGRLYGTRFGAVAESAAAAGLLNLDGALRASERNERLENICVFEAHTTTHMGIRRAASAVHWIEK